ncbi:hypothetical protein F5Y15DRAFT_427288 [Xylariaceae sp. FL0016]|nr:hypothetical protein F5Y15DRAFT_427288 [Xylariaceae sp. FL0016]
MSHHPLVHPPHPHPQLPLSQSRLRRPQTVTTGALFPTLSQPNSSSTSLIPNTAQGKPIPLDDSKAAHRTTALRELSRSQPSSRHRYTKNSASPTTTSTTTGTYSQPVLVRTYSGPSLASSTRSRPTTRRIPFSPISSNANTPSWRAGRHGTVIAMPSQKGNKKAPLPGDDAKLPPLEAFSFKTIVADMQHDMSADLDRIAEICARSRYSLSNQYEVHVAPHGSGASFLASPSTSARNHAVGGPTLQAISSDDEHAGPRNRKRAGAHRSRSAAYGTLETIMSSSRSSDEDKTRKKSAAELAAEVRGRVSSQTQDESGSANSTEAHASSEQPESQRVSIGPNSMRFASAIIDSTRRQFSDGHRLVGTANPSLTSNPVKPETSGGQLLSRTSKSVLPKSYIHKPPPCPSGATISDSMAAAALASPEEPRVPSLFPNLGFWLPWRAETVREVASSQPERGKNKSYAERSLKRLL